MSKFDTIIIFVILFTLIGCGGTKPPKTTSGIQINIMVVDDNDKALNGATVMVSYADGNSETFTTNLEGNISLYNVNSFPVTVNAENGKNYKPNHLEIKKEDINDDLSSRQKRIRIERRKTIIFGRVVDIDTGEALPISAGPVTITTEPPSDITQTDRTGAYEIGSTDFEEGVFIAVRAQLPGKYEESTELAEINNYWGRNKVPTLGLKKLPGWEPPVLSDDSIKVIDQPPTGPAVIE